MSTEPSVATSGRLDAWLAHRVFVPPVRWLCRTSGWSSLRWARVALLAGPVLLLLMMVVGAMTGPPAERPATVIVAVVVGLVVLGLAALRWRATIRLERCLGELTTGAIPPQVRRELRAMMMGRLMWFWIAVIYFVECTVFGNAPVNALCGVGVLTFVAGCYWGTVFQPPGTGAVARVRALRRAREHGAPRPAPAPVGAGA